MKKRRLTRKERARRRADRRFDPVQQRQAQDRARELHERRQAQQTCQEVFGFAPDPEKLKEARRRLKEERRRVHNAFDFRALELQAMAEQIRAARARVREEAQEQAERWKDRFAIDTTGVAVEEETIE